MHFKFLNLAGLVLVLATTQAGASDVNLGRSIYQRHCINCHGADGSGSMAGAPDFRRSRGLMQSDQALVSRIESGKRACPAYRGILNKQEILDVIAYLRTQF